MNKGKMIRGKKRKEKSKYRSIKNSMMIAYCIPVALIVILGTMSYKTASKVVVEKYQISVESTMKATARYFEIVCSDIRVKASNMATDTNVSNYYSFLYEENNAESKKVYNDLYNSMGSYLRAADFLSDFYVIGNQGKPILSSDKTEAQVREIRSDAFLEFWEQEEASIFSDDSIKNGWVGYHPFVDKEYIGNQDSYAVSYLQTFPHKDGIVIFDLDIDNVKETLSSMNLGKDAITAMVLPNQREIVMQEVIKDDVSSFQQIAMDNSLFSNQNFFKQADKMNESFSSQVNYLGKDYFFVYAPINNSEMKLCALIPLANLTKEMNGIRSLTIIFMIIGTIIALACGTYISYGISKVLKYVGNSLKKVSEGDLTQKFDTKRKDELLYLTDCLTYAIGDIRDIMGKMHVFSNDVNNSAIEVAQSSNAICSSMQSVSASLEEVNKGVVSQAKETENCVVQMSDFSRMMDGVSSSTQRMNEVADRTIMTTKRGQTSIERLNEKSDATTQIVEELVGEINGVVAQSDQIGGIIKAINEIAEQTSLLSLNASIEAARAGNQGKGFAVVAEEIRKLADQSKMAGNEIHDIINQIRTTTENASNCAHKTNVFLEDQAKVMIETTQMFSDISQCINELVTGLSKITDNLQVMIHDKDKISDSISYISSISEEAAAFTLNVTDSISKQVNMAEKLTEKANTLNDKAKSLNENMMCFQI